MRIRLRYVARLLVAAWIASVPLVGAQAQFATLVADRVTFDGASRIVIGRRGCLTMPGDAQGQGAVYTRHRGPGLGLASIPRRGKFLRTQTNARDAVSGRQGAS